MPSIVTSEKRPGGKIGGTALAIAASCAGRGDEMYIGESEGTGDAGREGVGLGEPLPSLLVWLPERGRGDGANRPVPRGDGPRCRGGRATSRCRESLADRLEPNSVAGEEGRGAVGGGALC